MSKKRTEYIITNIFIGNTDSELKKSVNRIIKELVIADIENHGGLCYNITVGEEVRNISFEHKFDSRQPKGAEGYEC